MKIWYQSYSRIGFDRKWKNYHDNLKSYVGKVGRSDTVVDVHGVEKMSPKITGSDYIKYMHISQVIDNALRAEREGYDAFCLGGTLDLGHVVLREVLDIPVVFILESSLYHACLLARRFAIIGVNEVMLRRQLELVRFHGLEERSVPSEHLGRAQLEIVELFGKDPQLVIELFTETARKVIARGAGVLVPGFGALSSFFGQRGIHSIDDIPIVDIVATVIKTAEMLVDLRRIGVHRSRKGFYTYASKEDLIEARKLYGFE